MNYLCIDMGSKNTVIARDSGEVCFNQPTVVAMSVQNNVYTNVAFGNEAMSYHKNHKKDNVQLVNPFGYGMVDRQAAMTYYLAGALKEIVPTGFFKPMIKAIVCVSCGLNNGEKRGIEDVCRNAGIKDCILVESPIAVSTMFDGDIKFLVDIGHNKTEIAIVGENGIITGCSIDVGGKNIDNAIIDYISDNYKIIISANSGEEIKCKLCSLREDDTATITIKGRAVLNGVNSEIKLSASEFREVIAREVNKIADVVEKVSMMIPDKAANIIAEQGFYFTGGTMYLPGIAEYLRRRLCIKIVCADNNITSVAVGGAKLFYMKDSLKRMLNVDNLEI